MLFFPGFEHNPATNILQPVLAWNNHSTFSGAWAIASWNCCPGGQNLFSTPVGVKPDDKIKGFIRDTCTAGTVTCPTWRVTTTDATLEPPKSTTFPITGNTQTFNWAFPGVLEAYKINQCSDYPPNGQLRFSDVALYDYNFNLISDPNWSTWTNPGFAPQCGYVLQQAQTHVTLEYLPAVLLNPYGSVQFSTTPPPYSTVVVDGNLCSTPAEDPICTQGLATDVTVTLNRQVISQCGCPPGTSPPCVIFDRNDTVVISQGQTTGTFSDYAGRDPSCPSLPITTQWTVTEAVLAPTNLSLNLSVVPSQQLTLSVVF